MPRANSPDRVLTQCPDAVRIIDSRLRASGHQVFVVGGAVRDAMLEKPLSDWDLVTSATPDDLVTLLQDIRHFTLRHGTVTLVCGTEHYEVTPFKGKDLYEDLALRDFTVDAMAFDLAERRLFDLFRGQTDLRQRTIRAVGDPEARFREDPLRLLRAVRLAAQLGFTIEPQTLTILTRKAAMIQEAAMERIREELMKILLSSRPSTGLRLLVRTCLLGYIIPELLEGYGKRQNPYHRHTIFKHILLTVDRVNPDPVLRLAALFHDIGKPKVRKKINGWWHFYGHEKTSAEMTEAIMERLRFSTEKIQEVVGLVRHHMLAYDPSWTDGAVRRLIARVGQDIMGDLLALCRADKGAMAEGTESFSLLDELEARIQEQVSCRMPSRRQDLCINGHQVMTVLGLSPGPQVGEVLRRLTSMILDHPELNTHDGLYSTLHQLRAEMNREGDLSVDRGQ